MNDKKRYKRMSLTNKIVIITISIVLFIIVALFLIFKYIMGDLTINKITNDPQELGIVEKEQNKYINNIAIFGLDGRNQDTEEGRSDSLMVVSINKNSKKIKLVSILRDSYVAIDGHSNQKINHAYSYGGPLLAIKTINQNFKLNIKDYISVNFDQFITVVDTLGGININITEQEKNQINNEVSNASLTQHGEVHLNGDQTLAYTRLRKIDSDNARADRQKNVIEAIIQSIKSKNKSNYISLIKTILPSMETSLQYNNILEYVSLFSNNDVIIEETTIPGKEENAKGGIYEGSWVWRYNLDLATERLHRFIYG